MCVSVLIWLTNNFHHNLSITFFHRRERDKLIDANSSPFSDNSLFSDQNRSPVRLALIQ